MMPKPITMALEQHSGIPTQRLFIKCMDCCLTATAFLNLAKGTTHDQRKTKPASIETRWKKKQCKKDRRIRSWTNCYLTIAFVTASKCYWNVTKQQQQPKIAKNTFCCSRIHKMRTKRKLPSIEKIWLEIQLWNTHYNAMVIWKKRECKASFVFVTWAETLRQKNNAKRKGVVKCTLHTRNMPRPSTGIKPGKGRIFIIIFRMNGKTLAKWQNTTTNQVWNLGSIVIKS